MREVTNNDLNQRQAYKEEQELEDGREGRCYISCTSDCNQWSLSNFATNYYSHWVTTTPVRVVTIVGVLALLAASVYGIGKVEDGLELTDVVPRNTSVWRFLETQDKYFGFYNMYAITEGNYEYPQNQRLMYEYHDSFVRVHNIIKDDNGGLPEFWLSLFRTWLSKLQDAYDNDLAAGLLDEDKLIYIA